MTLSFKSWYGLFTRASRGTRPVGALDLSDNLVFNTKTLKPSLRTGYFKGLTAAPSDLSQATALSSFRYPRGVHPATETPTAQNLVVIAGTDGSAGKHYFQRPFWRKNNATIESTGWLKYREILTTTMSGKLTAGFDLDSSTAGADADPIDYYNGWIVYNSTRDEHLYIIDSVSGNVTTLEDLPSDWANGDSVTLYRHFHNDPGFAPSWTDPIVLKQGNNIIASGGQGSTAGYKAIWSGLVNQTWFPDASRIPSYNQTYVSELEGSNDATWLHPQNATDAGSGSLTPGRRFWIGFVPETFDGQRGLMYHPSTAYIDAASPASSKLSCSLRIHFPQMDKRVRYVHVFMAETDTTISAATSIDWTDWFFIETHDMCSASSGFTYTNSTTTPGYYSKTVDLDLSDWNAVSESGDLVTFLGHTKPNRKTVSFAYGLIAAGRLIVAHYYDYYAALNFNDSINFTPFSGAGISQYAKILDIDDQVQTTIEAGDPSSVKGLAYADGNLVILKDSGSFYINITADPSSWILSDISRKIGCDAPDSVVTTPFGVIWAKSGDGVYLWRQGEPIEISRNWRVASDDGSTNLGFRGLTTTYASSWFAWYDPFYRSYRLMYTSDGSTKTTLYEAFLDIQDEQLQGLPIWGKHTLAHNVGNVLVRSDNVVFFSTGAAATYQFGSTSTQDGETTAGAGDGTQIRPYFHTGDYAVTEDEIATFLGFSLSAYQSGSLESARQLDLKIYTDGTVQKTFSDVTGTSTRISSRLPLLGTSNRPRNARRISFEFNTNASRRGLGTAYRIEELAIDYEIKKRAYKQSL